MASATVTNQIAATCSAVQSLNLADNELRDDGLIAVCECLKQNKNLKELSLDRNWVHKSKNSTLKQINFNLKKTYGNLVLILEQGNAQLIA